MANENDDSEQRVTAELRDHDVRRRESSGDGHIEWRREKGKGNMCELVKLVELCGDG